MTSPLSIIITGANRGLGLELVRSLASNPPITPLLILACARNPPSHQKIPHHAEAKVQWCTLDVADLKSIQDFSELVQEQCLEGVDVLINNSGVNLDIKNKHGTETATRTMDVNYRGTLNMMKTFIPLMRSPPRRDLGRSRIVNISSVGSKLTAIPSNHLRMSFRNASSLDDAEKLGDQYLASVSRGTEAKDGWPRSKSYCVSKALINSTTQILAAQHTDLLINACCPGWCQTDMGSLIGKPTKTTAEGARIPLKLAFGDVTESGKYWENPSVYDTEDGQVSEWYA